MQILEGGVYQGQAAGQRVRVLTQNAVRGVIYDRNLHHRDLEADTPFNTYTRPGLPPTPIALPGLAALTSVMHPAATDALYFVARGDGSHEFSATLEAHNRAVAKYQLHQ